MTFRLVVLHYMFLVFFSGITHHLCNEIKNMTNIFALFIQTTIFILVKLAKSYALYYVYTVNK